MKITTKLITYALASTLSITVTSCGEKKKEESSKTKAEKQQQAKTHQSVTSDYISNLDKIGDAITTIKDLDSAKSAIPNLTKLGFKLNMCRTDLEKLGTPTNEIKARLDKELTPKMNSAMKKIGQSMESLKESNPDTYNMVNKTMNSILH